MILASIDIGTNSVLLTIVTENNGTMEPVLERATITRLGEAIKTNGSFLPTAMDRTIAALKDYKNECNPYDIQTLFVVGTSAMRRSTNSPEFIKRVQDEIGLLIEIISGEREAELSYLAVAHDFGKESMVLDIGGGSTEWITPKKDGSLNLVSLPLGAVTLHEQFVKSDPINNDDFNKIQNEVARTLQTNCPLNAKRYPLKLVATAGTATTLAAMKLELKEYDHDEVHGHTLSIDDIDGIIHELKIRTIEERKKLPGLEAKRADVILPGALILRATMNAFKFKEVTVSDRGVRWGLIYEECA